MVIIYIIRLVREDTEVSPRSSVLLGLSEGAAESPGYLLDRTEAKGKGKMTGFCALDQSGAKPPSPLLCIMEKWV